MSPHSNHQDGITPPHMKDQLDIFICPSCRGDLQIAGDAVLCLGCRTHYQVEDGIPLLFVPNEWDNSKKDVTDRVKSFYEEVPFPNYEELETIADLMQKAQKGVFARLLNEQLPFNIRVLEVGCGTGQLSNFLGVAHRTVFGTDMCFNSLKLAQNFKKKNNLERVGFYQMNLFRPIFREESFPLVICLGVLHHTSEPLAGFQSISKLVKKGGYIIIGLYNRYARTVMDIRRIVFKLSGDRLKSLDPYLRETTVGERKKLAWFRDQYDNPHESQHTVGEVLRWFDKTGFDFVNSVPKLKLFDTASAQERIFKSNPKGNWFNHFIAQANLLLTGGKEGGFFLMIGRRRL